MSYLRPNWYKYRVPQKGVYPFVKPVPYSMGEHRELDGVLRKTYNSTKLIGSHVGACNHCHAKSANLGSNQVNLINNRAIGKLDEQLTVINSLFESWYERREAYALLGSAIKKLLDFTRNWKKPKYWKKLKTGVTQPTALPEAWLAYGFGIQPLIGLVNDCMKGLAKPLDSHTFKGVASGTYSTKFEYNFGDNIYGVCNTMIIYGCTVRPKSNPNIALATATGLNQPFSSAWSVAPWGWAVDYFANVSELLSNIEVKHPHVDFIDYYKTTVCKSSWTGKWETGYSVKTLWTLYNGHGYSMSRAVLSGYPKYNLAFSFPVLGSNQLAYLTSALAITLKGKSK